ncbi:hypothetical protein PCASD_07043 [Puccinia coronata f. sp. avenae]|uniref:No apical meristem-associated C-terminal domain-containing protein n=1 Tax=Puccinia coronata f. sp. avenae TaxID=200324 RepID=A0A2N5V6Y4_9BASI|nr:hypothetical protein PCASD_07043 [Puccinia coronata f. sp. avenae]
MEESSEGRTCFCAIHQKIEEKPPSGSSPSDWLIEAKKTYFEQEGRQFIYERSWNLLRNCEKFMNMAKKGKAKNGRRDSLAPNILLVSSSPSPAPATLSENQTESETVGRNTNWKRPPGIKAEKRKIKESDFRQKKLKLLEKSNNESTARIAEARRANDIQEKLARIDQNESDRLFMLQSVDDCPDEEAKEFFLARQKEIMDRVRNPAQTSSSLSARTQATPRLPGPSSETNGPLDLNNDSSDEDADEEESVQQSYTQSDARSESEMPWLDPHLS